jgi:SAM-dependent methyltransferase
MSGEFTGERLHADAPLFALDLARHQAAYEVAGRAGGGERVLDLGSGSGHGTAFLQHAGATAIGLDRVAADAASRVAGVRFVRGDVGRVPFRSGSFDRVASFQVIEHLEDPSAYLAGIARLLRPGGTALLTTPNRLTSDGVNPYHVHEYVADELAAVLRRHFGEVEMRGIGASERVRRQLEARSRRIRRIMRLDPLRLRERLPRAWIEWLFARLALRVRRAARGPGELADVSPRAFPVGPADAGCLDLLAVCRRPRP